MNISGVSIEDEVREVLDHVSPFHRTELVVLLHDDPEQAYIKARMLRELYWQEDIREYVIEDECAI